MEIDLIRAEEETATAKVEKFQVQISEWSGPYDLLLQVIDEKELNILDLNISVLLEGYLSYLEHLDFVDLDDAGEFLVVAATLAQIKSKLLLPEDEKQSEEEEEDPRAELARYLMEYQKIKKAAEQLRDMPVLGRDVFIKGLQEQFEGFEGEGRGTLFQLVKGFQKAVRRVEVQQPFQIEREDVSVSERFNEIFELVQTQSEVNFDHLVPEGHSKVYLIASFLAVLELVRMKKVQLFQREYAGPVFLKYREGATLEDVVHSEFDEPQDEAATGELSSSPETQGGAA